MRFGSEEAVKTRRASEPRHALEQVLLLALLAGRVLELLLDGLYVIEDGAVDLVSY